MTISQILPAGNDIAHVNIHGGKAGAVKGRCHLHLTIDALLAQHRYAGALTGSNIGRGKCQRRSRNSVGQLRPGSCA